MLENLPKSTDPNLLVGTETSDDAGIYRLSDDIALVNTVDYFTPIVDDPYTFGAIAATNSLSDVYSMGGHPKTALNITCWPKDSLELSILGDIVRGGADKATEAGAALLGGHTVDAPELMYGLAVTGVVHPEKYVKNYGARKGDVLILTKNLGIGILTTGLKFNKIKDHVLPQLVESMTRLNASASSIMLKYGVSACTDVTGYGLLGHASEMASGNSIRLRIESKSVPYFEDAPELVAKNTYTQAYIANSEFLSNCVSFDSAVSEAMRHILMEAETSGGLLFSVPAENADAAVQELHAADCPEAAIIGEVVAEDGAHIEVH
ncbi:selenide, water dikinase SelD [Candidatus Poribacteria bacterium]|nr:selenide, water dikinase SelD [Candidatus Poribacteria bacterium]